MDDGGVRGCGCGVDGEEVRHAHGCDEELAVCADSDVFDKVVSWECEDIPDGWVRVVWGGLNSCSGSHQEDG